MNAATPFRLLVPAALLSLCLFPAGCSGPKTGRVGDSTVVYDDPHAVETVSPDYGSTDLQSTAEFMTQSLLDSPWISKTEAQPRIRLREVKNYTDEHIDAKGITDKIRVKLLQSGKVRFLADAGNLDQVYEERDLTENATRKASNAPMLDSDYIITGAVRSIRKKNENMGDVFYQITMELTDPQSGEILWANEKEIRKTTTKPSFGW